MRSIAKSRLAPFLGQHVPLRGPARLLNYSYAKSPSNAGELPRRLTNKFGDTFEIDLSSFLEWQIWAFGSYEDYLAQLFEHLVRPNERCIDVGANIGVHTVRLAKLVGAKGNVIALEPDESLAHRIEHNADLNGLANTRVIQAAAAKTQEENVVLYRPGSADANKARASLLPHSYLTGPATKVPAVSLDKIVEGPVALIKIDVEGTESAVVAGAADLIETYYPSIIFEYAPNLLVDGRDSPFEWLRSKGFETFGIRQKRHRLTGRGTLQLEQIARLPNSMVNILAIPRLNIARVRSLLH
jgi:FkbM family methyltransferase